MRAALLLCVSLFASGCFGGGCTDNGPTFDTCDNPGPAALTTLELVLPNATGGYTALDDFDVIGFTYGGQGSPMIGVYLRMTGTVPRCLAQTAEVRGFQDTLLESDTSARTTYAQGDGSHVTKGIFLIMNESSYGALVKVIVSAGGMSTERRIYVDGTDGVDASGLTPDAGTPDASPLDASVADAANPDASLPP